MEQIHPLSWIQGSVCPMRLPCLPPLKQSPRRVRGTSRMEKEITQDLSSALLPFHQDTEPGMLPSGGGFNPSFRASGDCHCTVSPYPSLGIVGWGGETTLVIVHIGGGHPSGGHRKVEPCQSVQLPCPDCLTREIPFLAQAQNDCSSSS